MKMKTLRCQNAAGLEFPATDSANAGMRRKFDLPLDRPMNPWTKRL